MMSAYRLCACVHIYPKYCALYNMNTLSVKNLSKTATCGPVINMIDILAFTEI